MKLAAALRQAGLHQMAEKAATGYYHDFLSPLAMPCQQLLADLTTAAKAGNVAAHVLRARHINGDFDASLAESDAWAESPDGRAAFAALSAPSEKPEKRQ